ncbi:Ribonuclease [Caulifigura coniformis]|uniref:Ribonuclease n=1 Tax=Caulifigura coniformis TaxID=2527983 RepID=A0A517SHT2_9PLAN|nr:MBL fold metallo-hydrolase [Caulifigura coniformis]QDT55679.1 Ribonuclease [Caulifigura coniformis]
MKITFLGAAGEVTGSQHLLETSERRILLDCGLFQGPRAPSRKKNEQFHCRPKDLDAVILSHAHTDHCGNLPGLYRAGFRGPVFCTSATADVAEVMLLDGAKIQAEDVRYLERKLRPGHPPIEPLYDEADVRGVCRLFERLSYSEWHELGPGFKLRFSDAGHILGSAITELHLRDKGETKRVTFTGDLGRRDMPLLKDPELLGGCDVLITESTYGNRVHPPADDLKAAIVRILKEAVALGGRVIVPAFSLGRTQQLVYFLNELFNAGTLPHLPILVDSPLSRRLTNVFRQHMDILDEPFKAIQATDADPFGFATLSYVATKEESVALNRREGAFMVISASGMCESGRIVHHLKNAVSDERNTVLLIGYQAPYTLGRQIADRRPYVRIFDREYPLRAHVEQLEGLSAHADLPDFKWWFEHMARDEGIGQAFLVHGEPESARSLAEVLKDYCNEPPIVPGFGESFEVE